MDYFRRLSLIFKSQKQEGWQLEGEKKSRDLHFFL